MAAKDLYNIDTKKQEDLDDITTCCICIEVYTDPKALPCIHTFCMKCIQETGLKTNKRPGDEMPCPICRRLFRIPAKGFRELPKNFFIERLIQVSKVSDSSAAADELCSLCLEESEEQQGKETPIAATYCVDCKHKLCEECCNEHKKFKLTKNHKLIPINEQRVDQNSMVEIAQSGCELHEQQVLNIFCGNCKTVVCAVCFIEEHKHHEGSHVSKCLDGFRKQIEIYTVQINECIAQAQVKKAEIMDMKEEMHQRVGDLESEVERRKEEIKQSTDKHACYLLEGLCSERQSRLKEIQMATDDTDDYISNLESYSSYCRRILDKGSASDICSALSDLSVRATELQEACQPVIEREIPNFRFSFSQSQLEEFLSEDGGNLVGEIQGEGNLKSKKRSKQILLAELSNEIDLLRKEIENESTKKKNLQSTFEQQPINADREAQNLREELIKREANYNNHVEKLKQELDNNKISNNALQINNNILKQELAAEKTTNNSLQVNNDKLVEELELCKATLKISEANSEKLMKKLGEQRYKSDPVLVQTIRTKAAEEKKKNICALAILDNELFVVHDRISEVEVYDADRYSFSRRWNLKELNDPMDMASCIINKCLYIFDYKGFSDKPSAILRVDPNGNVIKNWSSGERFGSLSVTGESTVILASHNHAKFNEYSPDGQLIREINLPSTAGILSIWRAIKLTNGHFVVSHGGDDYGDDYLHGVCTVDSEGKLKNSFGGKCGSAIGQMNRPVYLSVDTNGFVMVADQLNSRVLLLDADLKFKREILSEEKHGLRYPQRILLDELNGRLFVAQDASDSRRILVFDL